MTGTYDVGDLVRLRGRFGTYPTELIASAAPGALTVTVCDPEGYGIGDDIIIRALEAEDCVEEQAEVAGVSGQVLTLVAPLEHAHGAGETVARLTDPTTVTLKVKWPDGNLDIFTYGASEVTQQSTGRYYRDVSLEKFGTWLYRWEGTGAAQAAEERSFYVHEALVT